MSQSVACALEVVSKEKTRETRVFIRKIDKFFDCLNVRCTQAAKFKLKDSIAPYRSSSDERFTVHYMVTMHAVTRYYKMTSF